MTWFKVDDGYAEHPKTLAISLAASGLWVRCGAWSARYGTDGFISQKAVWRNCDGSSGNTKNVAKKLVKELCASGFWDEVNGGYKIHDFLEYNFSKADIQRKREESNARVTALREKRKRERNSVTRNESAKGCNTTPEPEPEPEPEPTSPSGEVRREPRGGISEFDSYSTSFEQFWSVYPWQCDKPDAYREYRRATVKTNATIIIAAAGNYAAAQKRAGAPYTSKPATWLRNEGWLNKPQPRKTQAATGTDRANAQWDQDAAIYRKLKARESEAQDALTV